VVGHYPANVEITLFGFWTAALTDVGAGAGAQIEIFIRDNGGNVLDKRFILNKVSDLAEFWSDSESYGETLAWSSRLEPGTYEVGLRVTASAQALAGGTGITDINRNMGFPKERFVTMSTIDINFLEEVNPFFDGPDLQNPKDTVEVNNLVDDWSNTGEIDGTGYNREEVIEHLDQWDVLWEIVTDQSTPKSELTLSDVGELYNRIKTIQICALLLAASKMV